MTSRTTYSIIPQRHSDKRGWQLCAPHQAQAWAIVKGATIIRRFESYATAKKRVAQLNAAKAPTKPSIGGRMPHPRPDVVLSQSLTRAEYNELVMKGHI